METMAPLTHHPPPPHSPTPSVQRGCNSYFADHKRKNIPKNRQLHQNATQAIFSSGRSVGLDLWLKQWRKKVSGHPGGDRKQIKGRLLPAPENI